MIKNGANGDLVCMHILSPFTCSQSMDRAMLGINCNQTFKILKGKTRIDAGQLFQQREGSRTRGHSLKLFKPLLEKGLLCHANFFSCRVINDWNSLPQWVVDAETVKD